MAQTPSPSPLSDRPTTTIATGHPMLVPLTVLSIAGAFIGWNYLDIGSLGVLFSLGNGVVGAWGFWTVRIELFNSMTPLRTVDHDRRCSSRVQLQSHAKQRQISGHQDFYSTIKPLLVLRRRNGRGHKRKCRLHWIYSSFSIYIRIESTKNIILAPLHYEGEYMEMEELC